MAALTGWQPSTDGDARVNFSTIMELRVIRISANTQNTSDPQGSTEAWAVFAILTEGKQIQVQPTRTSKSAAAADLASVSGI
jgi:hypothetical protein